MHRTDSGSVGERVTSHDPFVPHRIGDLAEVFDGPHATPRKVDQGPWYLNIASLKNGRLDLSESAHIHADDVAKWTARVKPKRGDTLFSYETRLGESAFWDRNDEAVLGRRMGLLRPREDKVDPRFLAYAYLSDQFQEAIRIGTLHGATVNRIPVGDLPNWEIMVPSLPEQRRIAGVLGAFDDLIETNRDLARSQEALARALGSRGDGEVAIEELAEVPKLRQRRPTGLVDHFAIPAFDNGQLPAHDLGSTILSGKYVLRQPSVLLSRLNPSTPRTWMAYPGVEEAVCSPEFVVLTGRHGVSTEEVWAVTSSDDFWKQMQSSVGGTTNSRQRVDKAAVPELIVPDVRLLSAEERAAISTLVRGAHELRVEAADLAAHRDELLPLLMSGKVRVSEVEGVA